MNGLEKDPDKTDGEKGDFFFRLKSDLNMSVINPKYEKTLMSATFVIELCSVQYCFRKFPSKTFFFHF